MLMHFCRHFSAKEDAVPGNVQQKCTQQCCALTYFLQVRFAHNQMSLITDYQLITVSHFKNSNFGHGTSNALVG